jgi:tripartite-type tricarboxylate transporter receptor subunit TctC
MLAVGEVIRARRIRPLASSGHDRVPSLAATVPTLLELGFSSGFDFTGFIGAFAPAQVPAPILKTLTGAFRKVANSPEMLQRLRALDTLPGYEDPETFGRSVEQALRQWEVLAASLDLYATG